MEVVRHHSRKGVHADEDVDVLQALCEVVFIVDAQLGAGGGEFGGGLGLGSREDDDVLELGAVLG